MKTLGLLLLIATVVTGQQKAATSISSAETMSGISAVRVLVSVIGEPEFSVHERRYENDVEIKLRQARVRIDETAQSCLCVRVIATRAAQGVAYRMDVQFRQVAFLQRGQYWVPIETTTWERGVLIGFVTDRDEFDKTVRPALADEVDEFVNQYLKMNPIK